MNNSLVPSAQSVCKRCVMCAACTTAQCHLSEHEPSDNLLNPQFKITHQQKHLFRAGDAVERIYYLRSGTVKTYTIDKDGIERVVGFAQPGDLLGANAIDLATYPTHAVTLNTVATCSVPLKRILGVAANNAQVQHALLGHQSRLLRESAEHLLHLQGSGAEERVAAFLLKLALRQHQQGYSPNSVALAMPRIDMASFLAMAVETVSRAIKRLQEAKIIKAHRTRIDIQSMDELRKRAGLPTDRLHKRAVLPRPRWYESYQPRAVA